MSLLFNMLSRFVIDFLRRSKHLLISWLQSASTVILESKKIKSVTVSIVSPSICHEVMGPDAMTFVFWMLSSSQLFRSPLSSLSRDSLVPFHFLPKRCYYLHIWVCLYFSWHFPWCTLHISWISRMTIYSLDVFLSQFGTSLLFHVRF